MVSPWGGLRTGPDMPEAEAFASLAGALGIDESVTVIVYDANGPMAGMWRGLSSRFFRLTSLEFSPGLTDTQSGSSSDILALGRSWSQ